MSACRTSLPGFVDLQVNGYKGVDFSAKGLTPEQVAFVCRSLAAEGTAAFVATVISSPIEVYEHNLPVLASVAEQDEFKGRLLGIHLEGPFVSDVPGAIGCHNAEHIEEPDTALFDRLFTLARGRIRMMTVAAEVAGAEELARHAASRGVRVLIGHSMAMENDLAKMVAAGATGITHLGNAVPNTLHRHNNPLWAALAEDRLSATMIADGIHVPPPMLKSMIRAKGVERTIVISDSSPPAGLPPGRYVTLGNETVLEKTGRLYNPEKQCLVGSSFNMLMSMNFLASLGFLSPDDLAAVGFRNPLAFLGLKPADIAAGEAVVFNETSRQFAVKTGPVKE